MTNIIACIQDLFEKMSHSVNPSLCGGEIDWDDIEETRERLVRMRFKNHRGHPHTSYKSEAGRPNTALASNHTFGAIFRQGRPGMHQWVTNYEQAMLDLAEKESNFRREIEASLAQDEISFEPGDVSYEPFLIPGVTCDKAPDTPDNS
ncbi:MAG TPA: hypothetical protein V6C81_19965 [Planktothrix sp.]|jgi:hypothetical protein